MTDTCKTCGRHSMTLSLDDECGRCHNDTIQEHEWEHMTLRRGKYIGPGMADKDKTALVKVFADHVMVQFDEFEHPKSHFWHRYELNEWELFPEPTTA